MKSSFINPAAAIGGKQPQLPQPPHSPVGGGGMGVLALQP
jgi:hypothetical protein